MNKLSERQAFDAMQLFIEKHYQRTKSVDFAAFLGDLERLSDGKTADPAADAEWRECIETVTNSHVEAAE